MEITIQCVLRFSMAEMDIGGSIGIMEKKMDIIILGLKVFYGRDGYRWLYRDNGKHNYLGF